MPRRDAAASPSLRTTRSRPSRVPSRAVARRTVSELTADGRPGERGLEGGPIRPRGLRCAPARAAAMNGVCPASPSRSTRAIAEIRGRRVGRALRARGRRRRARSSATPSSPRRRRAAAPRSAPGGPRATSRSGAAAGSSPRRPPTRGPTRTATSRGTTTSPRPRQRAGVAYYPKLVLGVPVHARGRAVASSSRGARTAPRSPRRSSRPRAPSSPRRRWADCKSPSPPRTRCETLEALGLAVRVDFQYHWRNEGYRTVDEFLARFPSKRRNAIKRERAAPASQGIAIRTVRGDELSRDPAGWARECFALHRASTDKMAWGMRWVNRRFYERLLAGMPDAVEIVEARREGRLVAMAFNLASRVRLYGRYWGAVEDHPFLHFNVALYHSIDECIRRGVQVFEGGAGGEHKLSRGFEPAETHGRDPPRRSPARRGGSPPPRGGARRARGRGAALARGAPAPRWVRRGSGGIDVEARSRTTRSTTTSPSTSGRLPDGPRGMSQRNALGRHPR